VVEDDGTGIPAPHADAVFERFYRIEGGKASGSGLGLAIAREIARLMGGEVLLASRKDPTVLVLDLPATAADGTEPDAEPPFSRENGGRRPRPVSRT
jgi:signal transduction histidine kinase